MDSNPFKCIFPQYLIYCFKVLYLRHVSNSTILELRVFLREYLGQTSIYSSSSLVESRKYDKHFTKIITFLTSNSI